VEQKAKKQIKFRVSLLVEFIQQNPLVSQTRCATLRTSALLGSVVQVITRVTARRMSLELDSSDGSIDRMRLWTHCSTDSFNYKQIYKDKHTAYKQTCIQTPEPVSLMKMTTFQL